jgi:hypothetical protein
MAEPVQLTGAAIKTTLPGSVLKLDTPLGMVVPIRFDDNGLMSGDAGQLASYLGSRKDRGRYWLSNDRVCYRWFRWFSGEQHCLAIQRDGKRIFWQRDDGESGTATLEEHHKPSAPTRKNVTASKPVKERLAQRDLTPPPHRSDRKPYLGEPVLIKLPTPAVRPRKKRAALAEDLPKSRSPDVAQAITTEQR